MTTFSNEKDTYLYKIIYVRGGTREYAIGGVVGGLIVLIIVLSITILLWRLRLVRFGKQKIQRRRQTRAGNQTKRLQPETSGNSSKSSDIRQDYVNHAFEDDVPSANTPNQYDHTYVNYHPSESLRKTRRDATNTCAGKTSDVKATQENQNECPYENIRHGALTPSQLESEEETNQTLYENAGSVRGSQASTDNLQRDEEDCVYDDTKGQPVEVEEDYEDTWARPKEDVQQNGPQRAETPPDILETERGGCINSPVGETHVDSDASLSVDDEASVDADGTPTGHTTDGDDLLYAHLTPVAPSEYQDFRPPSQNPTNDQVTCC